ncbi:MFS transporter [Saccharolobus solfataricus]|uniref:MFS transporter n=1 Tax=Saccharolobus solfataricus TaxID=2287 RepID=A0A7S9IJ51_SACSO|nr:MFS transporter [Saccharolobus solfataricus]QPG50108.1 MFS transporter [Saccharolobus solfataricus]
MSSPFHYKQFTKFTIFSVFAGFSFIQNELTTYWFFILLFRQEITLFGLGVIARPLVRVFVSYLMGYISDKYDRAKLFYITRGISGILLFPLTFAFIYHSIPLIFGIYYIRTIIVELSNNVGYVAYYAVVPEQVRAKAIFYIRIISMASRVASGAVWYLIYQLISAYDLFLAGILGLIGLALLKGFNIGGGSKRVKLSTAIDFFRKDERIRGIILLYSVTDGLTYSINYLLPLLIIVYHGTEEIYSLSQTVLYGILVIASFVMTRIKDPIKIVSTYILSGFLFYLVLLYPSPYVLLISVLLYGFGSGIVENYVMATIKQSVGDEFLGSVLGLDVLVTSSVEIFLILLGQYLITINVVYYIIVGIVGMSLVLISWLLHPKLKDIKL